MPTSTAPIIDTTIGTQKIRVAYITESFTMGGVERITTLLMRELDRTQFEVLLLCPCEPDIAELVSDIQAMDMTVIQTELLSVRRSNLSPKRVLALARLLKEQQIDVLHVQVLGGVGARYIKIASRVAGIRVVITTVHGVARKHLTGIKRLVNHLLDPTVTLYTTPSENNRRLQIEEIGISPNKIKVLYNAIDFDSFDPTLDQRSARASLHLPLENPIVGMIGRLEEQKGVADFLAMAALVRAAFPSVHFLIVGDGDHRPHYEQIMRDSHLEDCVTFTGYRSDIPHCLAAMDIFALASIFEPFGLVLAEAMAMQKPVVATDVGGIPEVVSDQVTGLLVPVQDPPALAEAVLRYLNDPALARQHGYAGRERTRELFTIDRMAADHGDLYRDCLKRPKNPASFAPNPTEDDRVPVHQGLNSRP